MDGRRKEIIDGPTRVLLVVLMGAGCLCLFIGVPVAWLWIGSQVQGSASLGTALAVTMAGVIITVVLGAMLLSWLNQRHAALQEARNAPISRHGVLEPLLVASAAVALLAFLIWFFVFAGASPVPLNISY